MWSAFKYFDINDEGFITAESITKALQSNNITVDKSGLNDVFLSLKTKTDNRLSFGEFKELLRK